MVVVVTSDNIDVHGNAGALGEGSADAVGLTSGAKGRQSSRDAASGRLTQKGRLDRSTATGRGLRRGRMRSRNRRDRRSTEADL